ncbi:MAG: hypothetical protein HYX83_01275 [Chloroflexi bacterium]|nr:hypothetical protein [Chloroflexota bacterium]
MVRLVIAIVTTIFEEAAIVVAVLWGLPALGVRFPVWLLIVLMAGWAAYSVSVYRLGTKALKRKPVAGLSSLDGCQGTAVTSLSPNGMVRIMGELWSAQSADGVIDPGDMVEVVGRENMKLRVRRCAAPDTTQAR